MEIHNPAKLGLPPLMIEKQADRLAMEESKEVKEFVKTNLLLDKDLYQLAKKIASATLEISKLLA